jgi:hypothetical protein
MDPIRTTGNVGPAKVPKMDSSHRVWPFFISIAFRGSPIYLCISINGIQVTYTRSTDYTVLIQEKASSSGPGTSTFFAHKVMVRADRDGPFSTTTGAGMRVNPNMGSVFNRDPKLERDHGCKRRRDILDSETGVAVCSTPLPAGIGDAMSYTKRKKSWPC